MGDAFGHVVPTPLRAFGSRFGKESGMPDAYVGAGHARRSVSLAGYQSLHGRETAPLAFCRAMGSRRHGRVVVMMGPQIPKKGTDA